jgi:DNA-binding transcriptional MerR regulator
MLSSLRLNVDMKSTEATFAIGDVAQRFGLATHVLRHWESMGLLTPARVSGQRRYTVDDLYRVATILRGKQAGISLDRIQQMITTTSPGARARILRARRDELERRIAAMQEALGLIDAVLNRRHADFTQCPSYRESISSRLGADVRPHRRDRHRRQ